MSLSFPSHTFLSCSLLVFHSLHTAVPPLIYIFLGFCLPSSLSSSFTLITQTYFFFQSHLFASLSSSSPCKSLSLFFLHISLLFAWIISSSKPPLPRFLSSLLCCGSVRSLSDFNDLSTWVQSVTLIKLCHFHLFLPSIRPLVLLTLLYRKGISPCLLMTLPSVAFRLSFHFPLHLNYFT